MELSSDAPTELNGVSTLESSVILLIIRRSGSLVLLSTFVLVTNSLQSITCRHSESRSLSLSSTSGPFRPGAQAWYAARSCAEANTGSCRQ